MRRHWEEGENKDESKPPTDDAPPADSPQKDETEAAQDEKPSAQSQDRYRFKVEYVPLARMLETYGGRKLEDIERGVWEAQARRGVRGHDELGESFFEFRTKSDGMGERSWDSRIGTDSEQTQAWSR